MYKILVTLLLLLPVTALYAQKYTAGDSRITIGINAPAGNLVATDSLIRGTVDAGKGDISFSVNTEGFYFTTPFMPAHVNEVSGQRLHEYYLETSRYPAAVYTAKIRNTKQINFRKDGVYTVQTEGALLLHGVKKKIAIPATVTISNGIPVLETTFILNPKDFGIRLPEMAGHYYFREVTVKVSSQLKKAG